MFELDAASNLVAVVDRQPEVSLDKAYYGLVGDFESRVKAVPSLARATALRVKGDWTFDTPVDVVGDVSLADPGAPRSVTPADLA